MYNQIKHAETCPKTMKSFPELYPNARNYRLYQGDKPEVQAMGATS